MKLIPWRDMGGGWKAFAGCVIAALPLAACAVVLGIDDPMLLDEQDAAREPSDAAVDASVMDAEAGSTLDGDVGAGDADAADGGPMADGGIDSGSDANDGGEAGVFFGKAASVAAGSSHSCAVTSDGGIVCWGENTHGELGNNTSTPTPSSSPVAVFALTSPALAVAAGTEFTCAIFATSASPDASAGGALKCWGYNHHGQLGDGTGSARFRPTAVVGLESGVLAVTLGGAHTCALTATGGVKCWGYNVDGQLGIGPQPDGGMPTQVTTPTDVVGLASGVAAISAGSSHTCALMTTGGVKCWGDNSRGQLGSGVGPDGGPQDSPVPVDVLSDQVGPPLQDVLAIAAGELHSCAVKAGGTVSCWGFNTTWQLGFFGASQYIPVDVASLTGVVALSGGRGHTCARLSGASVKCWGWNALGQLGFDGGSTPSPHTVSGLDPVTEVSAGYSHTCVLTSSSGVQCWGWNQDGQLGNGAVVDGGAQFSPTPVNVVGFP